MSHCLKQIEIINPHWNENTALGRSNLRGWRIYNKNPTYPDDYKILVPCGRCLGCLRDKATSWRVRLLHEHMFGNHQSCTCLTLTIAPEYYEKFQSKDSMANAMRSFIDRLRYYMPNRRSPKRFFVSELGEQRGRLHFHGFIWDCPVTLEGLRKSWSYGFICAKPLRSARQLSYATKYITKPAVAFHKPTIYVSPGLGKAYCDSEQWLSWHKRGNADLNINMCCRFDHFVYAMPRYYRDKIFTDDEISRFKVLLSDPNRPFEKVLGKQTYTEPFAYLTARERVYQTSLRSAKSQPVKFKPQRLDIESDNSFTIQDF